MSRPNSVIVYIYNCICFIFLFSGIPGVLNNAYKMSSMFPKAPPSTSAPPHHILHACNRLVTPVPVTTPPSPTKDDNYGMVRYIHFHSVRLTEHCFQFEYPEFHSNNQIQCITVGCAYYCQLIIQVIPGTISE